MNTESSRVIFFLEKITVSRSYEIHFFFHLPWFISEKLGLGCLLERKKVLVFRSEVTNLTKTLYGPHSNVC